MAQGLLRVGSLFAGIGGIELGLERAGMRVVWQVENNPFCLQVLEKNWPGVKRYGDIRELCGDELEPVDLICGGFPCQPHSVAGKRKASDDERDLWPEMLRIIREVKPRWVLAENVPGILSSEAGWFFGGVLRDLAQGGYSVGWDCIPAQAVGAPHRRERIFIVGALADTERVLLQGCNQRQRQAQSWGKSGGAPEPRLGRVLDGLPNGLDEIREACRWPAGLGPTQHDWEPSRIATGMPHRVNRLRALGNAVVPQAAELIGRAIVEVGVCS